MAAAYSVVAATLSTLQLLPAVMRGLAYDRRQFLHRTPIQNTYYLIQIKVCSYEAIYSALAVRLDENSKKHG